MLDLLALINLHTNVAAGALGYLSRDVWTGIGGTQVSDLIGHSKFHQAPDISELILGSEGPSNDGENYGSRLRGTITAPLTGSYTFWIAGDDGVELWLSTDDRKFGRQLLAWHNDYTNPNQWDRFSTQQSAPICLVAGQKYYVEALHKEGVVGDHLSLAWSYEADDLTNWTQHAGAVASQSTTSIPWGHGPDDAAIAINGSRASNWTLGQTTHTDVFVTDSWWQVDLGADRSMERISVFNRTDCCANRLANFRLSILNSAGVEVIGQDYHTEGTHVEGSLLWDLPTAVTGRTVRISLLGTNGVGDGILSLAEVEVMGSSSGTGGATPIGYLTNWTQDAAATAVQSTTSAPWGSGPDDALIAIDGNTAGWGSAQATHTDVFVSDSWWEVDLAADRPVNRIVPSTTHSDYDTRSLWWCSACRLRPAFLAKSKIKD